MKYLELHHILKKYALEAPNEECCGLIIKKNNEFEFHKCKNSAKNKEKRFRISDNDFLKISQMGQIFAVYHSHKSNKKFSIFDRINCAQTKYDFLMYCLNTDLFNLIESETAFPYLERSFKIGTNDCYTLIREYYIKEKNIELPIITNYEHLFKKWDENFTELYTKYKLKKRK